jgi:hypothetical protein
MNDGISVGCENANSTTLKKVGAEIASEMKHFMMKQLKILVKVFQHDMEWLCLVVGIKVTCFE